MKFSSVTGLLLSVVSLIFVSGDRGYCGTIGIVADSPAVLSIDFIKNEDVLSSWRALSLAVENCNGKMARKVMEQRGDAWTNEKYNFMKKGNSVKTERWAIMDYESKTLRKRSVSASNPHYFFSLRNRTESESVWEIFDMHLQTSDITLNSVIRHENDAGPLGCLVASYSIMGVPLWDMVNDENFIFLKIDRIGEDKKIVSIDFSWKLPSYLTPPKVSGIDDIIHGRVELNSHEYWKIEKIYFRTSYNQSNKRGVRYTDNYLEYSETEGGVPYVVRILTYASDTGHGRKELPASIFEVLDIDFTPVPDREFTLSHYGFPEPNFGDRRPSPVRYTLMVIGMLMIAYALWRMYKKRNETML